MKVTITYEFKVEVEIDKMADLVGLDVPWPVGYEGEWSGGTCVDHDIGMVELGDDWTGKAFIGPDGELDCECSEDECPVCKAIELRAKNDLDYITGDDE